MGLLLPADPAAAAARMGGSSSKTWDPASAPDLSGKTALVTGANSGLGLETVKRLAEKGATVVLAWRVPSARPLLRTFASALRGCVGGCVWEARRALSMYVCWRAVVFCVRACVCSRAQPE